MRTAMLCAAAMSVAAASAHASQDIALEVVVTGLINPLGFVQDPIDADVQYIVQQNGVIRVLHNGALRPAPFADLDALIATKTGERGLLGLAFPPDHAATGAMYVSYTDLNDDSVVARVFRSQTDFFEADLPTLTPLLHVEQPFSNHNGGNIVFGPDGMLYIGLGDGGSAGDPDDNGQDPSTLLGAILRIDVSDTLSPTYAVPAGNPFVGVAGRADEIWSWGLRNPWRFTFDEGPCGTGAMLIADVGQNSREEINYEPAGVGGRNYGWNCREGLLPFLGCDPPEGEVFTNPIFDYNVPGGQSITGGYVYRGRDMPRNRGRYFYADFIKGIIWSLDVTGGVAADNILHIDTPFFISTFGRDAQGELFVSDYFGGRILKIVPTAAAADLNDSGGVDGADLGILLGAWGGADCGPADLNNDGVVNGADLGLLLGAWGG